MGSRGCSARAGGQATSRGAARTARATRLLARHAEADRIEAAADYAAAASAAEHRERDAAAWSKWLLGYAERCALAGGADVGEMVRSNPRFVPRAWVVDAVVAAAEQGD